MDVSLNQVIEVTDKSGGGIDEDEQQSPDVNETDDPRDMPEGGNPSQSGNGFHYQIRNSSDNGQVTYRVVQVGGDDNNQQATLSIVTTNGIFNQLSQEENGGGGSQVAIVGNPFNSETGNDSSTGGGSSGQGDPSLLSSTGQFYVMMSPQEMIQSGANQNSGRTLLSRASFQARDESCNSKRDDTRRVQHNEVERRRRDKINTWIMKLATMIPECANDHTKQGQSKGGILAKACEYINELQAANSQLSENLKDFESMQMEYELCRQQLEEANQQVRLLQQTLQAHQIELPMQQTQ